MTSNDLSSENSIPALVFKLGNVWLGINTQFIKTIADPAPVCPLPRRNNRIMKGIINIDGELIPFISLCEFLTPSSKDFSSSKQEAEQDTSENIFGPERHPRVIVSKNRNCRFAFEASSVKGIFQINKQETAINNKDIEGFPTPWISTFAMANDIMCGILDEELLFKNIANLLNNSQKDNANS